MDVDLKLDPEPPGIYEAIGHLKNELDVNVELVSPDQFIPLLPDWKQRSTFHDRHGAVEFYHYDFRAQALAKLARGYERDLADVAAMLARRLVTREDLTAAFDAIEPDFIRYPALDGESFARRVTEFLEQVDG